MSVRILLVDDDPQGRQGAQRILEAEGYLVSVAADGQQALEMVRVEPYSAILTDVRMPRMSGLDFFKALQVLHPEMPVVLMTAYGRLDEAVWAMKLGAVDFLSKPFKRKQLVDAVAAAVARVPVTGPKSHKVASPAMVQLNRQVEQVASTAATVLIQGESGVGKERVARQIHALSPRRSAPFVAINCAAIPEQLLESELFGHEKGAFTGAVQTKQGLFEAASGGTLLLDEIGDMPLSLQSKLLRVIQEGEVRRVGAIQTRKVDVRLLAATHQDLRARVAQGLFREDLLYRLEVIVLGLPPLRERPEDIQSLVQEFFEESKVRHGKTSISSISGEAWEVLRSYGWPGNVRELFNAIERAVVLCQGAVIEPSDLPPSVQAAPVAANAQESASSQSQSSISIPVGTALKDVEDLLIRRTLEATHGNKELTAQLLGIASRTIYRKLGQPASKENPDA